MLGLKMSETAGDTGRFIERLVWIGPAAIGDEQRRHRVPRVALQVGRRTVIAGHNEDRRLQRCDVRHNGIELFYTTDLFGEVTVFAGRIGVFEVDEEEIVFVPRRFKLIDLFSQRRRLPMTSIPTR